MPQLEPIYYTNTIKYIIIAILLIIELYGKYIYPRILERNQIILMISRGKIEKREENERKN
jgi:hypothetical protein